MKLFHKFNIWSGIAAFKASATDSENNSKSAIFHGLYRPSVVMIRKCPKINNIITTSTISPKLGLTSNGAAGGVLVVPFTEKLDAEVKSVDAADIATVLKTSQSVWVSRVSSSSRAVQLFV